jgi:hypothetical protein
MFVTFDTNAYRELVHGKSDSEVVSTLEGLLCRERHRGVQALANPFVLLELAAHLSDNRDRAYQDCKVAIRALVKHCAINNSIVEFHKLQSSLTPNRICVRHSMTGFCRSIKRRPRNCVI